MSGKNDNSLEDIRLKNCFSWNNSKWIRFLVENKNTIIAEIMELGLRIKDNNKDHEFAVITRNGRVMLNFEAEEEYNKGLYPMCFLVKKEKMKEFDSLNSWAVEMLQRVLRDIIVESRLQYMEDPITLLSKEISEGKI